VKIHKNLTNSEIAVLLRAVAASYQIENENKNKFRIIAYNRAADAIEHLGTEAKDIWDEGDLSDVSGIGTSIAEHLGEIFKTGKSKHFEKILIGIPKAALLLMEVEGIGPKRAFRLAEEFRLPEKHTLEALKRHAKAGDIAKLEGFGEESQKAILTSINEYKEKPPSRMLLSEAENYAVDIIDWMKDLKSVQEINTLGSLRRKAPTVGDVDLSVATEHPQEVIEHFARYPKKLRVINKGEKSSSLMLPGSIRADLKVETKKTYGALLQHFTGSKHHNVALREYSLKKGMSLSEHGIKIKGKLTPIDNEVKFYNKLGMDFIPPELREGAGEIEAALRGELPKLVELSHIKGDLQMHSDYDIETSHDIGASSMMELVEKANSLNYEYIAVTEHNPSQRGHNMEDNLRILQKKREYVNKLNNKVPIVKGSMKKVFNSLEIDMLPDGRLPVDDKGLETLDFALVSIHSSFKKSREEMTKRVLSGLSHPKVKIFAHPTARLLEKREGVELNWEKIFDFCIQKNKWIEINADPHRLDLPDFLIHDAVKHGVKLTLGTDAHHKDGMDNMRYGVAMARRGWAEKKDIINTLSFKDFTKVLK
jgi:DNA polymerase (family 10)